MLSEAARTLPARRLNGEYVEVTDETRPLYHELVAAELMEPLHNFARGRNSAFRITAAALRFKVRASPPPFAEAAPSPRH